MQKNHKKGKERHTEALKEGSKPIESPWSHQTTFLIDFDILPPKDWMKGYFELVPIILRHYELAYEGMAIHQSKICRDCGKSRTDFISNLKKYRECRFCGSKRVKKGRGMHIFIRALGRKLTPKETAKIQFLLLSDPHKELLGLKKIKKGLPYFNKMFSMVIFRKPPKKTCIDCKIRQNMMKIMGKF